MTKNKKHYLKTTFTICLLILILSLMFLSCTTTKNSSMPVQLSDKKETMTINKKTIKAMIDRAEPLIEEITGRKYKLKIEYQIINRDALRLILKEEILSGLRKHYKNLGEDMIKRQAEMLSQKRSQFYIGRYFKRKHILYVIPENIEAIKSLYKIKDKDLNDFIFIIIAHEMVHALDNQHYDLAKLLDESKNHEERSARSAVIGGSAAYVTRIIADRLNIPETSYINSLKLDICMEGKTDPNKNETYNLFYAKAEEFFKTIIKEKGFAEYGSAFTSPPVSTRQILYPQEYLNPPALSPIDCSKILKKITDKLPTKEGALSQTTTIGTVTLRSSLMSQGVNKKDAAVVADNFLGGMAYTALQQTLNPGIISVTILNFKDGESAVNYDETMKIIQKSKEDQFKARLNTSYNLLKEEEQKHKGFDMVRFRHVENKVDDNLTTTMEMIGIIEGLYVAVAYVNIEENTEKDMLDILNLIYSEQLKMKQI